jgi:hypothetical protein
MAPTLNCTTNKPEDVKTHNTRNEANSPMICPMTRPPHPPRE